MRGQILWSTAIMRMTPKLPDTATQAYLARLMFWNSGSPVTSR